MAKAPRKMLGAATDPHILALMKQIDTQSKDTVARWCLDYGEAVLLPLYEGRCPGDLRPRRALEAARDWLAGKVKLPYVKNIILQEAHAAAREREDDPAAQAAARALGQAASAIHTATHALGIAFYGAAAIAYDRLGTGASPEAYAAIAREQGEALLASLRAVSVENEPNPVRVKWYC
ncbi:MAG: hypothetical protein GXZ04_03235 [Clostridiales bacterium]|nr:hypothetical protein [Clostridiales bacterium]